MIWSISWRTFQLFGWLCYSSHNTSQNHDWSKTKIRKKANLQISKMVTHRHTNGLMGGSNWKQLNWIKGAANQAPLIHLNMTRLAWKWWTSCYLVVSSDLYKLSRCRSARIRTKTMTHKEKSIWRDCGQVYHQYAPQDWRRAWIWSHKRNDAAPICQCG